MTAMIALAFAVPLGLLQQRRAEERAVAEARVKLAVAAYAVAQSSDPGAVLSNMDGVSWRRVGQPATGGTVEQSVGDVIVAVRIPPAKGVAGDWWLITALAVALVLGCVLMADRFARRWQSDREFAADLSHRLRTPLTALQLDVDALPDGPAAERMRDAIAALDGEIDAVIAESRRTAQQRAAEECDLVDVVADRLTFWGVLADDHGRPWELASELDLLMVKVPRVDLIAAVDALLGNVFRHTPDGVGFRIELTREALTVEDEGPGIADPEAAVQRGASGAGSTGLGLSIVYRVARTAGGEVRIGRSELGGAKIMLVW